MADEKSSSDIVDELKIKDFPTILILKTGEKRPIIFKEKIGYRNLFDWLNIYSEQFVAGGDAQAQESDKPWLEESVPELVAKSSQDICFAVSKALCVIIFAEEKPADEIRETIKDIRRSYANKLGRGLEYKFMWLDVNKQKEWVGKFEITSTPSFVILNPGRRKRFIKQEGEFTFEAMNTQMEKISGGDARFQALKPNELPKLDN